MIYKVPDDNHYQLLLVVNENTSIGVDIVLKFGGVMHENRISFKSWIMLTTFFDMVSPKIINRLRFDNPVVSWWVRSFQLLNIDFIDLPKK